jgi:hypothetical protein
MSRKAQQNIYRPFREVNLGSLKPLQSMKFVVSIAFGLYNVSNHKTVKEIPYLEVLTEKLLLCC